MISLSPDYFSIRMPTIIVPENRKQIRLSLCGVGTHTSLWLLSFCSTEDEKTCFRTYVALHRCRNSLPHRTRVTAKSRERFSTQLRVLATKLVGRRSVSRGLAWDVGAWPSFVSLLAMQKRSFPIRNKSPRNGSGSHVPAKTSRHRPTTALKLGSEDSQHSGAYAL